MPPPPDAPSEANKARLADVQAKVGKGADETKALPDGKAHVGQARGAVKEPDKERRAKADQKQVKKVDDRPPPHPKIIVLCARIRIIIWLKRPPDEDSLVKAEPEKMAKEAGKELDSSVKSDSDRVAGEYGDLQHKPAAEPGAKPKPIESPPTAVPTPDPKAGRAAPDPVPRERANLDADLEATDKKIDDAGMNTEPAKLVDTGPVADARQARGELAKKAKEDPALIQAKQRKIIKQAAVNMQAMHASSAKLMAGQRAKSIAANAKHQLAMVKDEGQLRTTVSTAAEAIIKDARDRVKKLLDPLSKNAQDKWKAGIDKASSDFKRTLNKVDRWIKKRHSGVGGFFVRGWDALTGLPGWVTDEYDKAERKFGDAACNLAIDISRDIEKAIKDANTIIKVARTQVDGLFAALPASLTAWAEGEKKKFSDQIDGMQSDVDGAREKLNKELGEKLSSSVQSVREEIHRRREAAKGLIGKIADFVKAFLDDPVRAIINGLLSILGIPKAAFWRLVARIQQVMKDIADDPKKFGNNLLAALKKGFSQFFDNIGRHLLQGLLTWLFSKAGEAGVTLPKDLSLPSIITFFLQVMGITWARIRKLLVKHVGERNVAIVEKVFELLKLLMDKGIEGIFQLIKDKINPQAIFEMVMKAAIEYLIEALIKKVTLRIIAMLNPVGAILTAIEAIYRVIKWIMDNAAKIFRLVETVVNGVHDLLKGNIGGMANAIEKALAGLIPPVIDFLAGFLGLGGLPGHVAKVIKGLQDKVESVLDRVIGFLVGKAKALLAKIGIGNKADDKGGAAKVDDRLGKPMTFTAKGGSHRLWVERAGAKAKVKLASVPVEVTAKVKEWRGRVKEAKDEKAAGNLLGVAESQISTLEREAMEEARAEDAVRKNPQKADTAKAASEQQQTITAEQALLATLAQLFEQFGETNIFKILEFVGKPMVKRATTGDDARLIDPRDAGKDGKKPQIPGYSLAYSAKNSQGIRRLHLRHLDETVPRVHLDDGGVLRKGEGGRGRTGFAHLARPDIKKALEWVAGQSTQPAFALKKASGEWVAVFATGGRKLSSVNEQANGPGGSVKLSILWSDTKRSVVRQVTRAIISTFEQDPVYGPRLQQARAEMETQARLAAKAAVAAAENQELYFVHSTSIPRNLASGAHVIKNGDVAVSPSLYQQIAASSNEKLLSQLSGQIHHFVPLYLGGSHEVGNLIRTEGDARVKDTATRVTAHALLHQLIDEMGVKVWLNGRIQETTLKWQDLASTFNDDDLVILIGTLMKAGSISYQESKLPFAAEGAT
ncbi:hypothetical protein [Haliangium sp.]|uniref:phage tail protein n=1 Tax=Haliangium sp. TaxID=2663208 RepID=UPI003D150C70